jgi:peptidoglycan-associated lipoprotein
MNLSALSSIKFSGEFWMIKRFTLALTVVALVAGCSSGVKLDDVPVEDKNATSTMGGNTGANSGNTAQSGVAGVDLGQWA